MPKPKHLKSRLKASDRRRRRRPEPVGIDDAVRPSAGTDITGLLADAILNDHGSLHDGTVITALRSCKNGIAPHHIDAARLFTRFQLIAEREDVDGRGFRSAVDGLLALSSQHAHRDDQAVDPFMEYLALLNS